MMDILSRAIAWLKEFLAVPEEPWEEEELPTDTAAPIPARTVRPLESLICTPHEYKDARYAVRSLEEAKIVIICLTEVDEETAQRILDFVSGAVYLLHGTVQLMGGDVLLCTPAAVRVEQGDYQFQVGAAPVFRGLSEWNKSL